MGDLPSKIKAKHVFVDSHVNNCIRKISIIGIALRQHK
jgi:hypothetical protein